MSGQISRAQRNQCSSDESQNVPSLPKLRDLIPTNTHMDIITVGCVSSQFTSVKSGDEALADMLATKETMMDLARLELEDARVAIDLLADRIQQKQLDINITRRAMWVISRLCKKHLIFPSSTLVHKDIQCISQRPISRSGFSDVYDGLAGDTPVALRRPRMYSGESNHEKVMKAIYMEVSVWKRLVHPNVLEFIGVSLDVFPGEVCLVTPWLSRGNIAQFVKKSPQSNRVQLLKDIVSGLAYLHSMDIIHGDLKSANVLIDEGSVARLADFGLATITLQETTSIQRPGSTRWMAPELFEGGLPTKESDVYAFGMVAWEIFSGSLPFLDVSPRLAVITKIIDGERPERPEEGTALGLSDILWELIERCWHCTSHLRPKTLYIQSVLEEEHSIDIATSSN